MNLAYFPTIKYIFTLTGFLISLQVSEMLIEILNFDYFNLSGWITFQIT